MIMMWLSVKVRNCAVGMMCLMEEFDVNIHRIYWFRII